MCFEHDAIVTRHTNQSHKHLQKHIVIANENDKRITK